MEIKTEKEYRSACVQADLIFEMGHVPNDILKELDDLYQAIETYEKNHTPSPMWE